MKVVDLLSAPGARQAVEAEAAALAAVQSSDHVVRFQDLFLDGGVAHLVMERCDTSLVRFLEGVPRLVEDPALCSPHPTQRRSSSLAASSEKRGTRSGIEFRTCPSGVS